MRRVVVQQPSFPDVTLDLPLSEPEDRLFKPFCGDASHWRVGWYRPEATRSQDLTVLESHSCPELFLLIRGKVTLVLFKDGCRQEIELQPERPLLVQAPHAAYCPEGPRTGLVLVVERDQFETLYRDEAELKGSGALDRDRETLS